MDLPNATLEFMCGEKVEGIGMLSLAIKAHMKNHPTDTEEDRACIRDCEKELEDRL